MEGFGSTPRWRAQDDPTETSFRKPALSSNRMWVSHQGFPCSSSAVKHFI